MSSQSEPTAAAPGAAPPPSSTAAPNAAAPGAAPVPNAAAVAGDPSQVNSFTQVNGMGDLKEKAPKVYNAMLQGIAMHIVHEMKQHQDELKKLQREYDRK